MQLSDDVAVNSTLCLLSSCLLQLKQNKWNVAEKKGTNITCMHSPGPFKSKQVLHNATVALFLVMCLTT